MVLHTISAESNPLVEVHNQRASKEDTIAKGKRCHTPSFQVAAASCQGAA